MEEIGQTQGYKYQKYYKYFLKENQGKKHFACHSHHYWPDCTKEAQIQYWQDTCKYVDDKWGKIFQEKIPMAQKFIAKNLEFDRPQDISFASNTHELVFRVLSCIQGKVKILTTDSEFYSFQRQLNRCVEDREKYEVKIISCFPYDNFQERFVEEAQKEDYNFVFISQVFFNSGIALKNLDEFVEKIYKKKRTVIIDGYHAYFAIPTSLKNIGDQIFYVAGSYKYAQGGEGLCFMTLPLYARQMRPLNTGWYANLENLENFDKNNVEYPDNGLRFAGSTMDFTALYRMISVQQLYEKEKISIQDIHNHVKRCQQQFLKILDQMGHALLNRENLLYLDLENHGHFFTFKLQDKNEVAQLSQQLRDNGIITDCRGEVIRFGFCVYHDFDYNFMKKIQQQI